MDLRIMLQYVCLLIPYLPTFILQDDYHINVTNRVTQTVCRMGQLSAKRELPFPSAFHGMMRSLVSIWNQSRSRWRGGDLQVEIKAKTLQRDEIQNVSWASHPDIFQAMTRTYFVITKYLILWQLLSPTGNMMNHTPGRQAGSCCRQSAVLGIPRSPKLCGMPGHLRKDPGGPRFVKAIVHQAPRKRFCCSFHINISSQCLHHLWL